MSDRDDLLLPHIDALRTDMRAQFDRIMDVLRDRDAAMLKRIERVEDDVATLKSEASFMKRLASLAGIAIAAGWAVWTYLFPRS